LLQHRGGRVDADDSLARRAGDRDRDASVADREFDQRTVGPAREFDIERDVRECADQIS